MPIRKKNVTENPTKKFELGFRVLSKWLAIKQKNKSLEEFFLDNNISKIGIYGYGKLGERLFEELKGTSVEVVYILDKVLAGKCVENIAICNIETEFKWFDADVIVVTPVQEYWSILQKLSQKTTIPILSLEDVVNYCI